MWLPPNNAFSVRVVNGKQLGRVTYTLPDRARAGPKGRGGEGPHTQVVS